MDAGLAADRKARVRLRTLSVHAVALVPDGANLVRWAEVRKELGGAVENTAKILSLPKAAQETLADGLGKGIEALAALLDLVKTAQVSEDAAAQVPPEFAEQVERVGMMIAALGDQFDGGGGAPMDPATTGDVSPENMSLAKAVGKSIALKLIKACNVQKGRVKMDFKQAMKVHQGLVGKLYDIAAELAPMLAQLGDGDISDVLGPQDDAPAGATAKAAPAKTEPTPAAPAPKEPATLDSVNKSIEALSGVVLRIAKTREPSNVEPTRDLSGQAVDVFRMPYGQNLSADVAADKRAGS